MGSDRGATRFARQLGRWVGPVADRCGYGPAQVFGVTAAIYCGDPVEILERHPWAANEHRQAEVNEGFALCWDLQVEWRDEWVELRAEPFVHHALLVPAPDRRALGPAFEQVTRQLSDALDGRVVLEGAGPWDDPRRSGGAWTHLRFG